MFIQSSSGSQPVVPPGATGFPVRVAPAAPPSDAAAPTVELTEQQFVQLAKEIGKALQSTAHGLEFSVDSRSGSVIMRVVDSQTGEVIRQVPSEELLVVARTLDKLKGILLHRQA